MRTAAERERDLSNNANGNAPSLRQQLGTDGISTVRSDDVPRSGPHLSPDEIGGRLRAQLDVVVQLVQRHIFGDVLSEGHAVGLGAGASERFVLCHVADLVKAALVQEDRTSHLRVRRENYKSAARRGRFGRGGGVTCE